MSIAVGQTAPDFALLNQEKKEVKLSDFAGKKNVVLVWYPLDWSQFREWFGFQRQGKRALRGIH